MQARAHTRLGKVLNPYKADTPPLSHNVTQFDLINRDRSERKQSRVWHSVHAVEHSVCYQTVVGQPPEQTLCP